MKYIVVTNENNTSEDVRNFESLVTDNLNMGYELYGNIFIETIVIDGGVQSYLFQPMVNRG